MERSKAQESRENADEISFKDVILKLRRAFKYLKSKWLIILCFGIAGALIGVAYATFKKPQYTAKCTFVLDEGSSHSSLGQYAGLASLAGIDLSNNGGGLFEGDNILELYKSRTMIEKALLSNASFDGKTYSIIERYINFNHLRKKWKDKDGIDSINFNGNPQTFNRKQDSIISDLTELFNKKILSVSKPDKKLSIIEVDITSDDELFAKNFNDKLVETVNNFYVLTKTKKTLHNVAILQKQADSVRAILNNSISGVAAAVDVSPNANPMMQSLRVPSQRKQVDVQTSSAIYSGIVQNLELAKVTLRQETPLIQVIDEPVLPLKITKISKAQALIIGMFVLAFLASFFLLLKKTFNTTINA